MDSKRFQTVRPFASIATCIAMALFASSLRASPPNAWGRLQEVKVHTVEELYAAVNATPRCGVASTCELRIRLAPGTYVLNNLSPLNTPRPYQGSLRLRPGMSLVGSEEHVDTNGDGVPDPIDPEDPDVFAVPGTETTIDGSQLLLFGEDRTDCAGESRPIFPDPVIYIGRDNTISALSLVAGGNVGIGEPSNDRMDPTGSLSIEITDTVLQADVLTLSFVNSECGARRARSVLSLSHSVVRGTGVNIANLFTGEASNDPSDGPEIQATVAFNLFYNGGGVRAATADEGTDGASLILHSVGNIFRGNGRNLQLRGAVGRVPPTVGNLLVVTSESDTFGEAPQSVLLTVGTGDAPGNVVKAEFFDSRFIRDSPDTPPEITIIGGEGEASDNHATIRITGATVETSDGVPVEGGLSIEDETDTGDLPNTARLEGSREEFLLENQGLPAPPEHFFLGH